MDQPEAIIEALNEIARHCAGSQAVPVLSPKRKMMSDITNHIDVLPVAGIQSRGKRRRTCTIKKSDRDTVGPQGGMSTISQVTCSSMINA